MSEYNNVIKETIKELLLGTIQFLEKEEKEGRVPLALIAVTVEPTGSISTAMINRTAEKIMSEMGFIEYGEFYDLINKATKELNHQVKEKLENGIDNVIRKVEEEESKTVAN